MLVAATDDADLLLRGARMGVRGYLTMRSEVCDFVRAVESLLHGAVGCFFHGGISRVETAMHTND